MLFTLALQLQMREVSAWASTSFFLLDSSLVTVTSCCCCSSSSIGCQSVEKAAFGVWPSLFTQDRPSRGEIKARSRDAHQATVESDLLIKKKTHQLKLLTYANSVVTLLPSSQQPVYIWSNSKHTIQLMVWEVGTESPCVYENSREKCSKDQGVFSFTE